MTDWSSHSGRMACLALAHLHSVTVLGIDSLRPAGLTRLVRRPRYPLDRFGNIGATNVLRTGRKRVWPPRHCCSTMLKGTVAVLVAAHFLGEAAAIAAGLGAFLGHLFPLWLGFKGGKGVATFIGVLLGFSWQAVIIYALVWALIAFVTRYSSLSGLIACAVTPAILWVLGQPALVTALLCYDLAGLHHASRQYRAADCRHRKQDRPISGETVMRAEGRRRV